MDAHQEHQQTFATLPPTKLFFRCAIPSMISMAVTSLYVVADGMFVGRFIGSDALAAVNLVMPFIMMSFALVDMIAVGSAVQISIRLGEQDHEGANRIFSFSCLLIIAVSAVMGAAALFLADPLVRLVGAEGAVASLAVEYMSVYALFSPLIMIFFAVDNYLRICGKFRYSMGMNIVISVGNIALDALFIVGFGWGVWSAALASCLCLALGTAICFYPFLRKRLILKFQKPKMAAKALGNLLANGSSEFFSNISGSVYMVIVNAVLLRIAGPSAVAAFSIVLYVDSIVKSMLFGMGDSLQPAVSYNYGAGNLKRVVALERRVLLGGAIVSVAVMLWMLFGGGSLVALFVPQDDPALLDLSVRAMRLFSLSYLFSWAGMLLSSFFTALNRPVFSLAVSFAQTLVFPSLGLLLLTPALHLDGVWLTSLFSTFLAAVLAACFLIAALRALKRKGQEHTEPNES